MNVCNIDTAETKIEETLETTIKETRKQLGQIRSRLYTNETKMKISCSIISKIALAAEILFFVILAWAVTMFILGKTGAVERYVQAHPIPPMPDMPKGPMGPGPHPRIIRSMQDIHRFCTFMLKTAYITVMSILSIHHFRKIFFRISKGERPFDETNTAHLNRITIYTALMTIFAPLALCIAILSFALSRIFVYGNLLQQKADGTIKDQESIIFSFAEITENKSGQTGQHIKRVSEYSKILAEGMGLPPEKVEEIRLASVLHDIGKLLVDSRILEKPGKLTDEEFAEIKKHVTYGDRLLQGLNGEVLNTAKLIARDHHERYDGKGYTQGTCKDDISLEGRIVAVADVFDALTSRRSYKDAWDAKDAYDEIVSKAGSQFDPKVVETFRANYEKIESVRISLKDQQA